VKKLIEEGAVVVLCGSSGAMPKAVREALLDALATNDLAIVETQESGHPENDSSRKEAERLLKALEDGGRFIQETW